ncbi:MAG: EamA family transporter, partial [Synechococcaceae bacterium WB8_1A_041]|nr:EamA family transporter [Synechococcaceae bacterium WB8_1A_041]
PLLLSQRTWLFIALSGVTTGLSWICFFRALKQGEVSLVVPVDRLSLLVVAVLGFAFLGERPSIFGWLGLLFIGAGGVLFCFAE